eukprot:641697-Ditylum_brightwellii.AAC.1
MAEFKDEVCQWINNSEESLCNLFLFAEMDKITTGSRITRSYKLVASENATDAAIAYKNFLASQNIVLNVDDEHTESQEDYLENCWKEPPNQFILALQIPLHLLALSPQLVDSQTP